MAILLKTASVRVSSIQICKLESKTRAKVFKKVDTTETYHVVRTFAGYLMNRGGIALINYHGGSWSFEEQGGGEKKIRREKRRE